jgi:hypothetical protein
MALKEARRLAPTHRDVFDACYSFPYRALYFSKVLKFVGEPLALTQNRMDGAGWFGRQETAVQVF